MAAGEKEPEAGFVDPASDTGGRSSGHERERYRDFTTSRSCAIVCGSSGPNRLDRITNVSSGNVNQFGQLLLSRVTAKAVVMTEPIFGPVVGVVTVKDDDETIAPMNDSRYGRTGSIWTQRCPTERCGSATASRPGRAS